MSIRSEIADKLDANRTLSGFRTARRCFREGRSFEGFSSFTQALAEATLEVLDTYEEVGVEECDGSERCPPRGNHWLRMPDDVYFGQRRQHNPRSCTIYMKKQEPKPTIEEVAQRVVEAWRGSNDPFDEALAALAEKLDKP